MEPKKRKISVRKILLTIVTLLLATGCIMAVTTASHIQETRTIQELDVQITNDKDIHFLTEEQLYEMLISNRHVDLNQTSLAGVNLRNMEKILNANPWVEKADVFVDNKGVLHVKVVQREPLLRVFEQNGNSYYLDSSLKITPLSDKFTPYTMVITNVPELKSDSLSESLKSKMAIVAGTLSRDKFWNAQTAEIYLNNNGGFELIPVLGNHRVILNDTDMLQQKLKNVFLFYKQVLNRVGWDKYQVIDVSYKGQVVASPALAWNMPKDNAINDMNWVKTIVGDEPADDAPVIKDTTRTDRTEKTVEPPAARPVPKPADAKAPAVVKKAEPQNAAPKKPEPAKAKTTAAAETKTEKPKQTTAAKPKADNKKPADKKGKPKAEKKEEQKDDGKQPKYLYPGKNN